MCKYCCVLAIAEYFYNKRTDLCFFFVSISLIESVEKSLKCFFSFFPYCYKLFTLFLSKRFRIRQIISRRCFYGQQNFSPISSAINHLHYPFFSLSLSKIKVGYTRNFLFLKKSCQSLNETFRIFSIKQLPERSIA